MSHRNALKTVLGKEFSNLAITLVIPRSQGCNLALATRRWRPLVASGELNIYLTCHTGELEKVRPELIIKH